MSQWKKAQLKKFQIKQRTKNWLGLGFLALILALAGASVLIVKARGSIWDGDSFIGVVNQRDGEIKLTAWLPEYKQIYEWRLAGEETMEVPRGFGKYQLKNVYRLGELDRHGGELLMRTVQNNLGIPVSGWEMGRRSNLTWWDKLRLQRMNWSYKISPAIGNELIFNQKIIEEGLSLAILNASGVEGEAKIVSKIVANLGGEVRMVANLQEQPKSEIVVGEEKWQNSVTVQKISQALKIDQIRVGQVTDGRAGVAIIIAKDYTQVY